MCITGTLKAEGSEILFEAVTTDGTIIEITNSELKKKAPEALIAYY